MKLCIITCYKQPDYVRAKTLRAALAGIDGAEVIVVKNSATGLKRYIEVLARLIQARVKNSPDMYLLTFRGYEMLLPVRLLTLGKPLIYDEFINPIEWAAYEHKKIAPGSPVTWLLTQFYRSLLTSVNCILTDTVSHAGLSAKLMNMKRSKFLPVPVGTDETTFEISQPDSTPGKDFTVLYYGNMLPLHGLSYVIEAAVKLSHVPVKFVIVGGSDKTAQDVAAAAKNGAKIDYHAWVEFERLPTLMRSADLCLAGPFGGTFQADYVITGKAFQYMAMGRPMVVGKNKESSVFRHKKDALVVPQADAVALADAIRWGIANRDQLRNMGIAAQKLYERDYSTDRLTSILQSGLIAAGLLQPSTGTEAE